MNAPLPREYKGYTIYPCEPGSRAWLNGWKWEAWLGYGSGSAYSDTLAGIKTLVTEHAENNR